jgi:uncharacterized membrane protein YcaP (DUF421 family)
MTFDALWGTGRDLDALQMSTRAFVIFFIAIGLLRLSGRRSFARHTAFDNVVTIIIGTVLGRPVYGASPFWPVVAASTVFVVIHRLLGLASAKVPALDWVFKGKSFVLWREGQLDERAMTRHELSVRDLDAAARMQRHRARHEDVREIQLEANGELSVVD